MADDEATARRPSSELLRAALSKAGAARSRFRQWRRARPFWGGLLVIFSGLEILGTTQLSLSNVQVSIGLEGLQSVLIPAILITGGTLIWAMPVHRVFYGVIALVVALYSLIGVNLGGFLIGMLLGILGGSLAVAWSPREPEEAPSGDGDPRADDDPAELGDGAWDDLHQPHRARNDSIVPGMQDDRGAGSARLAIAGAVAAALIIAAASAAAGAASPLLASQTTGDDCRPGPSPTEGPDPTTSPDPTQTSTPDPSSTSDANSGPGLIESLLSTVTQVLDPAADDCEPTNDPADGPTADPTSHPTDGSTPDPTGEPEAGEPSEDAGEGEGADELDELGLPEGFEIPEDAELTTRQTLEGENLPVVAANPGRLTGSSITMTGLVYEGNVDLPTADGPLTVMKFTMDESVVEDFSLAVDAMGETLLTTTGELTISGDVTFYSDRFVGRLLGFKLTFPTGDPATVHAAGHGVHRPGDPAGRGGCGRSHRADHEPAPDRLAAPTRTVNLGEPLRPGSHTRRSSGVTFSARQRVYRRPADPPKNHDA